jgi:hypothetical protein
MGRIDIFSHLVFLGMNNKEGARKKNIGAIPRRMDGFWSMLDNFSSILE